MSALLTMGLSLAGCGSDAEAEARTPVEKKTVNLRVTVTDAPPMQVLFNHDDSSCSVGSIAELLGGPKSSLEVTVRDAGGKIVGTRALSNGATGGGWTPDGCEWPMTFFGLPDSEFYEVVATGTVKASSTVERTDDELEVTVALD